MTDPEVTIPFGAIIGDIAADRDMDRFTFLGELYRCPHDVLASALADSGKPAAVPQPAAAPQQAVPREKPELKWEALESSPLAVSRARVPAGWLVALGDGTALAFYPDPEHSWDGGPGK